MQNLVNKISETNTVSIKWMPGHEGHLGNEIADRLAKLGAQLQTDGAEPRLAVSQRKPLKNGSKISMNRAGRTELTAGRLD